MTDDQIFSIEVTPCIRYSSSIDFVYLYFRPADSDMFLYRSFRPLKQWLARMKTRDLWFTGDDLMFEVCTMAL